jgi:EpsI family protein
MLRFLNSTPARVVTVLLLLQGILLYGSIREEYIPESRPLADVPHTLGAWQFIRDGVVEQETLDILQADDLLTRDYQNGSGSANLFVAAFRSQRAGKAPHSPKNCLPGSGWEWEDSREMAIDVGRAEPIHVNRYIVAKGTNRSLVMYWYQSRDRTVASEYEAKFWVVADAIRYNRTDTALVRVVIGIGEGTGAELAGREALAEQQAVDFVKSFYAPLRDYLPS